ncbi:Signal peptidase II [Mycoplasma yeatsii 13926]|uniref:Lipoprotein signal peptidase n=1 Tax=Mycoplasma yeatsii 13926 TaxID=1188240 RepID=S6G7W2_9MOLU|nr:signal peptidase II [Mycoplasma yeatsii]EOA06979.1 Signal peptidase II [Mycoplasma yeatsii 13926]
MIFKDKILEWKVKLKQYNFEWKYKLFVCAPILIFLIASDLITKIIVANKFNLGQEAKLIPGFIKLKYTINLGMAYGGLEDKQYLVISIASIITFLLIIFFIFLNNKKWLIALVFILSGSFANLIARSWAPLNENSKPGGVIDFLIWDISWVKASYIFNLADLWVNVGIGVSALVIVIEFIEFIKTKFKKQKGEEECNK